MQQGKLTDEQNQLLQELPLNEISISSSEKNWKKAYDEAKKYYNQHGTLDGIKKNFVTENGIALGIWIIQQRRARRLEKLSDEQIKLLDEIEFVWVIESAFDKGMRYARAYFAEHGNLDVPGKFITSDGYPLGAFIYKYRRLYTDGKLSEDIIRQFEEMRMVWNVPAVWEMNYIIAKQYYDKHGCLPTMQTAQTVYEEKIAEWSANQLRELKSGNEKFKDKHKQQLNEIGIYAEANMQSGSQNGFQKGYSEAQQFFEESGHLQVPSTYRGADGFLLNEWIKRIRKVKDTLSDEQIRMLESIGIQWETETPWDKRFKAAKEYYDKHGVLPIKSHAKSQQEKEIATWIKSQKMVYSRGEMSAEHFEKLREIGLNLDERESNFERGYQNAKAYFDEHGNLNVPAGYQCENGFWLNDWIKKIILKKDKLLPEQVEMLNEIGIDWSELSKTEKQWELRFSGAERFYNENGYLPLEPKQCRNDAEKSIWQWLRRQLLKRDKGELTKE